MSVSTVRHLLGQILALVVLISAVTLAPIRPAFTQEAAPSWSYTGSLNTARAGHTATLLPNGKVLVVGGASGPRVPSQVQSCTIHQPGRGALLAAQTCHDRVTRRRCSGTAKCSSQGDTLGVVASSLISRTPRNCMTQPQASGVSPVILTFPASVIQLRCYPTARSYSQAAGSGKFFRDQHRGAIRSSHRQVELNRQPQRHRVYHAATLLQDGKVLVAGGCEDAECFFYPGQRRIIRPKH